MRLACFSPATILLSLSMVCAGSEPTSKGAIEEQILAVMNAQVDAWNAGDIEGYMAGYVKSDSLRFASGGSIMYGWQATLDRYKRVYSNRDLMGKLTFSDVQITVLDAEMALVFGRWKLTRKNDTPSGLFTLLFRKTHDGWLIFSDHTSSASP